VERGKILQMNAGYKEFGFALKSRSLTVLVKRIWWNVTYLVGVGTEIVLVSYPAKDCGAFIL